MADLAPWELLALLLGVLASLWAGLRFLFEPHVARIITRVIERRERASTGERDRLAAERVALLARVQDLEDRMAEREKTEALIVQSIGEMTKGFERLTKTLERVDERSEMTAESVARIEGTMDRRSQPRGKK